MFTAILMLCTVVVPQQDTASQVLNRAYEQLRLKEYDAAVAGFRRALALDPARIQVHKDLGYALLKMGETEQAVTAFEAYAMAAPNDYTNILELAYLYVQVKQESRAIEFFRRAVQSPDPAQVANARQGLQNVEGPILAEITRWSHAVEQDASNFDARESLAEAYVRHGDIKKAIDQYTWLRREAPTRYRHLITLSELYAKMGPAHLEVARAYALLAWRAPDARISSQGRAMFGDRYPFAYEMEQALDMEPWRKELRAELGYLYLQLGQREHAIPHFQRLVHDDPTDARGRAQLAALIPGSAPAPAPATIVAQAAPPPVAKPAPPLTDTDAEVRRHKELGYASLAKSYLADAAREFEEVHRLAPNDDQATLQLGYIYNMMHRDPIAIRWFRLALTSSNPKVANEARVAIRNISPKRVTTTFWMLPLLSSRFNTGFGYGQLKSELNTKKLPFKLHPYLSVRFEGDTTTRTGGTNPLVLSADGVIVSVGISRPLTNYLWFWAESGNALSAVTAPSQPDYRGGLAYAKVWGARLFSNEPGFFEDTNVDAVYLSRVNRDAILYAQTKTGYQLPSFHGIHHEIFLAANFVTDRNRSVYDNYWEAGPAYRIGLKWFPHVWAYVAWLHGFYTLPGKQNYTDLRVVLWWARSF